MPHTGEADDDGDVEVMPGSETVGREETPGVLIVRVRDDLDFGAFVTVYRSKTSALT